MIKNSLEHTTITSNAVQKSPDARPLRKLGSSFDMIGSYSKPEAFDSPVTVPVIEPARFSNPSLTKSFKVNFDKTPQYSRTKPENKSSLHPSTNVFKPVTEPRFSLSPIMSKPKTETRLNKTPTMSKQPRTDTILKTSDSSRLSSPSLLRQLSSAGSSPTFRSSYTLTIKPR